MRIDDYITPHPSLFTNLLPLYSILPLMDLGSIFLILGLLLLVALFIAKPLIEHKAIAVSQEEHQLSSLMAERDRILNALQELDFDFTLGKIPEADYPAQRAALLQQGAQILRELDAHRQAVPASDAEVRLEMAIAARRADAARAQLSPNGGSNRSIHQAPDDGLEALIASRRRQRSEKAAGFCPQCGKPVQKSDRFCPNCGATVA